MTTKYFITLLLLLSFTVLAQAQKVIPVTSNEVSNLLAKDKTWIVLDVRTPDEFKEGHIKNAINIDINSDDANKKIDKLNKNAKYIVHCRSNHRSGIAVAYMNKHGFKTIYQMMDGFSGWSSGNKPIEK
ncbi:MAG: rhodanese-like domain-containing protein [Bacteroidetes bacterium]|nr:rhodanese-like domain-containing protein [Bacteroidota bacterium]